MKKVVILWFCCGLMLLGRAASAAVFPLPPPGNDVVGSESTLIADGVADLHAIGRAHDLGFCELTEANPGISETAVPKKGTRLVLPGRFLLPRIHEGVVINIAELRLFYFPAGESVVYTYPIGVGRVGWVTPIGRTRIVKKKVKPTWIAPKSVQAAAAAEGRIIPDQIPPGPDNPLGEYSLRLGFNEPYLIHGTNDPSGVGYPA